MNTIKKYFSDSHAPYQFYDAIRSTGLEPPAVIVPGRLHRFPGKGKGRSNRAGWCFLFEDGLGGCFGDWSTGIKEIWQQKGQRHYSASNTAAFLNQVRLARAKAQVNRQTLQTKAAKRARTIWEASPALPCDYPYLVHKGIQPFAARLHQGLIVLPVTDFSGAMTSLQFIAANGEKRFLRGGRKRGCFIPVAGDMANASRIIICEGWATGCTLAIDEPSSLILAAIDAGNLEPVAMAARRRWASAELVIAGDDDRLTPGNPGANKAKKAAIASGALLALPQWPENAPPHLSDFNDLAIWLKGGAL